MQAEFHWLERLHVTQEAAGSSPVAPAKASEKPNTIFETSALHASYISADFPYPSSQL